MIRISSKKYHLKNVAPKVFWAELDTKTVGQKINPEISYSTQYWGNFDNVFAGRKVKDTFAIYLYRPIIKGFRTEILAKGKLTETNGQLVIHTSYEIPFWSVFVFILFGGLFSLKSMITLPFLGSFIFTALMIFLYGALIKSNYDDMKRIFEKELVGLENPSSKE